MASEKPYSVKPYEGPIHHTEGQWQNVIGPNGHRLNLRPMSTDEANHLARILNSASSAAADEVGRLREALEGIRDWPPEGYTRRSKDGFPTEFVYDEFAYRRLVLSYREYANRTLARTATDASGALTSAISPIPSAAKEKPNE